MKIIGFLAGALLAANAVADEKRTIEYGTVSSVEITTPDSKIAQTAIAGGVIGMVVSHNIAGTVTGAATGMAIASVIEGDRRVYLYSIDINHKPVKVLIELGGLSEGQCVAVETHGKHTNIRGVSSSFCLTPNHKALSSDEVVAQQQSQAKACNKARRAVLSAKTDDAIDHALVKVRALCE